MGSTNGSSRAGARTPGAGQGGRHGARAIRLRPEQLAGAYALPRRWQRSDQQRRGVERHPPAGGGCKNCPFVGSQQADERAAVMLSLIELAKINGHTLWGLPQGCTRVATQSHGSGPAPAAAAAQLAPTGQGTARSAGDSALTGRWRIGISTTTGAADAKWVCQTSTGEPYLAEVFRRLLTWARDSLAAGSGCSVRRPVTYL